MAIALVGSLPGMTNTGGAITPPFQQTPTNGNLLVAWVLAIRSAGSVFAVTVDKPEWILAAESLGSGLGSCRISIWYRPNCLSSDVAPTFNSSAVNFMRAACGEFSGAATIDPLDQIATGSVGTGTSGSITAPIVDGQAGDLQLTAIGWHLTSATLQNLSDAYGANATRIVGATTSGTANIGPAQFAYAITSNQSVPDQDTGSIDGGTINDSAFVLASFFPVGGFQNRIATPGGLPSIGHPGPRAY